MKMTTDSHNSNHFYVNVNFPKTARGENFPSKFIESLRDTDSIVHWVRGSLGKIYKYQFLSGTKLWPLIKMCFKTPIIKMKGAVFNAWTTAISYNQPCWRPYIASQQCLKKKKKKLMTSLSLLTYQTWRRVIRNHELNVSGIWHPRR